MALFGLNITGVVTGSTANTFITLAGLKYANTAGHRGRLRKLIVGGAGGSSQDYEVSIRVGVTDNTGDGTATAVNVNTIGQYDALSAASNVSAVGKNYTAEPTTIANGKLCGCSLNTRGSVVLEWGGPDAPIWGKNQTLIVQGAPGSSNAANLDISLVWEEGF